MNTLRIKRILSILLLLCLLCGAAPVQPGPPFLDTRPEDIGELYVRNYPDWTFRGLQVDQKDLIREVASEAARAFPSLPPAATAEEGDVLGFAFLVFTSDGLRHVYEVYNGGKLAIDNDKRYALSEAQAAALASLRDTLLQNKQCQSHIQWLVWMDPARVESVRYSMGEGEPRELAPAIVLNAAKALRDLAVTPGTGRSYDPLDGRPPAAGAEVFKAEIGFIGGITYTFTARDRVAWIESSDMSYGCVYLMADSYSAEGLGALFDGLAETNSTEGLWNLPAA